MIRKVWKRISKYTAFFNFTFYHFDMRLWICKVMLF